jgi:NADPH:quinone reductase-like Zn-dependent oxidoreductase
MEKISRRAMIKTTGGTVAMALAPATGTSNASAQPEGTMKAAILERSGSDVAANVRLITDWPVPRVTAGQVRVRTEAAALNHVDLWLGQSDWQPYPHVGGFDGCGIVEAVGDGVDDAWLGKRVIFNAALPVLEPPSPDVRPKRPPEIGLIGSEMHGSMAEKFVVPAANILHVGDADPVKAAAFGLTFLTAWRMISTRAQLKPDQTVLLTGIGGGVALAALRIVRSIGSSVIVTSRHTWKLDKAVALGAEHRVLDRGQDWSQEVLELTRGRGVDLCVDSVGKVLHAKCIRSLAQGGILATCGATTGGEAETILGDIYWKQLSVLGSSMGNMDEFREVTALFRGGELEPVVDSVFSPEDAAAAYARLQAGEQFGKVVVQWG